MANRFGDLGTTYNEQYRGPLLGLCIKCNHTPKAQISKFTGSFKVICTYCSNTTLDYGSLDHAITAWNGKNKLSIEDEIRKAKEGR